MCDLMPRMFGVVETLVDDAVLIAIFPTTWRAEEYIEKIDEDAFINNYEIGTFTIVEL